MEQFDIIILGGGLVGLTAANLCAAQNFSVCVIEKNQPLLQWEASSNDYDLRCSAISKASQNIFQSIGVWDAIIAQRASPYSQMTVWDALGFGEISFDAAEVAEPYLGHIIENRVMLKALFEKASASSNITFLLAEEPLSFQLSEDESEMLLDLKSKKKLSGKLLIAADGGHSFARRFANIDIHERDYKQSALVANVKTEHSNQQTAWQRFLPEGPLAFLPLSEPHTSSIVWTSTHDKIQALLELPTEQFVDTLAQAFDYRLGKVLSSSMRKSFPLQSIEAKVYVKERLALIGDAMHVIHPLAGQGVNLGLKDVETLIDVLSNAKKLKNDIGHYLILRKYERARKEPVKAIQTAMTFFNKTFCSKLSPIAGLRSIGLNVVNRSAWLKKQFILQAMGI